MADARYEDGATRPINLVARDGDDLAVISALVQDSVLVAGDLRYSKSKRRFALLINRFRWEDGASHAPERVRSLLVLDDVRQPNQLFMQRLGAPTGCAIIVTSRIRMLADHLPLDALFNINPLDERQARTLLGSLLGEALLLAEPQAVLDLIARCKGNVLLGIRL